jgi:hypothetical protein
MTAPDPYECKPDCILEDGHRGPCLREDDIAEERFRAKRGYERWADL